MSLHLKNKLSVGVTAVSNEFIDRYMAQANGEYVKVYLYLLRHEGDDVTVSSIADALNHTEADVKRALSFWKEAGIFEDEDCVSEEQKTADLRKQPEREAAVSAQDEMTGLISSDIPDPGSSFERMQKLAGDEEFSVLLYAVQQYLGKTFTAMECEKFAYFYDGLKMSVSLLEYLAEYCAGVGHTSIRYIEKVAIDWYQTGIRTRDEAKDYTLRFSRDMSAVMKAFGITGRGPAAAEQEFMKRWFKEFGFDKTLVTEACNRTITATGLASFPYADKILSGWNAQGVKTLSDVKELDKQHQQNKTQGRSQDSNRDSGKKAAGAPTNRFKNFKERPNDYESLVWEDMRNRQRGGTGNGTQ